MHGDLVVRPDDNSTAIEASHYRVDDDGSLSVFGGPELLDRCAPGTWIEVDAFGHRLQKHWPPPRIGHLLDEIATELAVAFGHYVSGLRDVEVFSDWRLNDLDSLTNALASGRVPTETRALDDIDEPGDLLDDVTYFRGALFFHALRLEIGDRAFLDTLRRFVDEHLHSVAGIDEYQAFAEDVSGTDLDEFFTTWIREEPVPALREPPDE